MKKFFLAIFGLAVFGFLLANETTVGIEGGAPPSVSFEADLVDGNSEMSLSQQINRAVQEAIQKITTSPIELHITVHDGRLQVGESIAQNQTVNGSVAGLKKGITTKEKCPDNDFTNSKEHARVLADEIIIPFLMEYDNFLKNDNFIEGLRADVYDFTYFFSDEMDDSFFQSINEAKSPTAIINIMSMHPFFIDDAKMSYIKELKRWIEDEVDTENTDFYFDWSVASTVDEIKEVLNRMGVHQLSADIQQNIDDIQTMEIDGMRVQSAIIDVKQIEELLEANVWLSHLKYEIMDSFHGEPEIVEKVEAAKNARDLVAVLEKNPVEGDLTEDIKSAIDELAVDEEGGFVLYHIDINNPPTTMDINWEMVNEYYSEDDIVTNEDDTVNVAYTIKKGKLRYFNDFYQYSLAFQEAVDEFMQHFVIVTFLEQTVPEEFFELARLHHECFYGHFSELSGTAWDDECIEAFVYDDVVMVITNFLVNFLQKPLLNKTLVYDEMTFDHVSDKKWLKFLKESRVMCQFDLVRKIYGS